MKLVSMKSWTKEMKILLLRALDFDSDGVYVLSKNGEKVLDKYTNKSILLENMTIFPIEGVLILDCNPLSMASLVEEYDPDFKDDTN